MRKKKSLKKEVILLVVLILALIVINYPYVNRFLENFLISQEEVHVDRVIDGDTIESEAQSIRLLGINTPERGERLYEEAKTFLEEQILNQTVVLEFSGDRYDKYDRKLAYVYINSTNINIEIVGNGYGNYYFYGGKDKYSRDLEEAWDQCLEKEINLCEKSEDSCSSCIYIKSSSILNSCSFSCDLTNWTVKGEGREKYIFSEQTLQPGEESRFVLDIANTGGTLFLRDEEGKLVDWKK